MRKQAGFTMIELVVVVMILGILAATALPKFMNVSTQAHEAAVAGTGGGLGAAVALAHAQYVANGLTGTQTNVVGFGNDDVDFNASGWPVSTNNNTGNPNNNRCRQVWSGVLQNPPTVDNAAGNADYWVTAAGSVCTFTYQMGGTMSIVYDSSNGTLTVDSAF